MQLDLEQWRELADPFYDVVPKEPEAQAGVEIRVATGAGLMVTELTAPAQFLVHEPKKRKSVCHDYLLFERFVTGGGRAEVGGRDFNVSPGQLHLIDMSRRYVSDKSRSKSRGVLIPHSSIGYVPTNDNALATIDPRSPSGRILLMAQEALVSCHDGGDRADTQVVSDAFTDLVRLFMLRQRPSDHAAENDAYARSVMIRDQIAANLRSPDLNARTIAESFGISRASLYRHFEADGGVDHYIKNLRLDRCFAELSGAKPSHGRVKWVAEKWCFFNASHFSRSFRDRFGVSPTDCFTVHPGAATNAPVNLVDLRQDWLAGLKND